MPAHFRALGSQTPSLSFVTGVGGGRMAKGKGAILVKLLSAANTGYFYVKRKNPRKMPDKLAFMKYDPIVKKHVLFTETKLR
ncbi:Pentatricopeptide repeat domain containing protein [Klebsormidium nitens]|uniref:Large ribosomal subunit protein bL33c n=1 Tax=Klebsormidium nitens TaxID=105231 RepID=A0A1Y1I4T1_KLENI|nr:Pentatricopeptide repeat domain containing protein [Klebsormidium nitens]|eukprot:GAQ83128.1 Pentatricopeptide repeat domain containing protein [Klebsormidium nitens]